MLSKSVSVSATMALGIGLVLPVAASPTQGACQAIAVSYAGMDKALVNHDVSAYAAHLHPAFVGVYPQGKEIHGKDKDVASLHQLFALAKTVGSSTQLLTFSLQDGGAVTTTRESFSMSGINAGEPIAIKSVGTVRGFWVKVGGRWLLKAERSLSDTTTVNGEETRTVNGQPVPSAS